MLRRILRLLGDELLLLPTGLDWLLSVVEPLVVLAIASATLYVGGYVLFGPESSARRDLFERVIKEINDNWKAGLLLLVLLFYRTARIFLEQAEEAFGVRKPRKPLRGEAEEGQRPSQGTS